MTKKSTLEELEKKVQEGESKLQVVKEALKENKTLLDIVFSQSPVPMAVVTSDTSIDIINDAARETLGFSPEELKQGMKLSEMEKSWQTYDAKGDPVTFDQAPVIRALRGETTKGKEFRIVRKDGAEIWQVADAVPIYDQEGNIIAGFAAFPDITDHKRAIELLKESEEKYRSMMEAMLDPVYICSPDFRVEYMNPAMIQRTGRDATGELCHKVINAMDEKCPWCVFEEMQQSKEPSVIEITSPKDGHHYHVSQYPIVNDNGSVSKMTIYRDITRRKQAEDALRKAHGELEQSVKERTDELVKTNEQLIREVEKRKHTELAAQKARDFSENIVNTVRDPLVVLDADLKVVSASRSFYKTFRLTQAQIQDQLFYSINNNQWNIPKLRSLLEKILTKNIYFENFEIDHKFDCIGPRILHFNARRLRDNEKQAERILLAIEDVTERILAERQNSERNKRRKEAAQIALLGHWELNISEKSLYWSDEIYRMFEVDPLEFGSNYDAFLSVIHPDDRELVDKAYNNSVKNKTDYDIVHRLLLKDHRVKYVHEKGITKYDEYGNPLHSMGTVQDITARMQTRGGFAGIVGSDPRMEELFESIRDLADVNMPVLIQGESGTGKEMVAAAIHNEGIRAKKPFVPVNCSALPEGLLESELFGHVKGAFTGAMRDKKGRFELADGGTLFLDEVADLPKFVQAKLLRVLQEGTFERVGDEKTISVDVRIISAANRDLKREVEKGNFRDDLYYRINVVPITMPPLRDRKNDIPALAEAFLEKASQEGQISEGISRDALAVLIDYSWPGNVRELQSAIRFALVKSKGLIIKSEHLPIDLKKDNSVQLVRGPSRKLSQKNVNKALAKSGGNKSKAAKLLGVGRATLYRFLSDNQHLL